MKRSVVLAIVAAAFGLSACTSTPPPAPDSTATSTSSSTTTPPAVVTEVVTQTVTNPPPPPAKPVIGSFGYGDLKLGMTLRQALDAKLVGPALEGGHPGDACTLHEIAGTDQRTWVSKKLGVPAATFVFGVHKEKKTLWAAYLALKNQDCHN
jgi:hypothetical protein